MQKASAQLKEACFPWRDISHCQTDYLSQTQQIRQKIQTIKADMRGKYSSVWQKTTELEQQHASQAQALQALRLEVVNNEQRQVEQVAQYRTEIEQQQRALQGLHRQVSDSEQRQIELETQYRIEIDKVHQEKVRYQSQIDEAIVQLNKSAQHNINKVQILTNWLLTLAVFVLSMIAFTGFIIQRLKNRVIGLESAVKDAKYEHDSERLQMQLGNIVEKQLALEKSITTASATELDHSFALKIADEISRIEKNLNQMDDSIRGIKQLNASLKRIKNSLSANGYEIIELLGMPYDEGMKVSANFIQADDNDNSAPDEDTITRIIKPQVNYQGQIIQMAQIEVTIYS